MADVEEQTREALAQGADPEELRRLPMHGPQAAARDRALSGMSSGGNMRDRYRRANPSPSLMEQHRARAPEPARRYPNLADDVSFALAIDAQESGTPVDYRAVYNETALGRLHPAVTEARQVRS